MPTQSLKKLKEEYTKTYIKLNKLCQQLDGKDPFAGNRGKELYVSIILRHELGKEYVGADGCDKQGGCEYKSPTGGSVHTKFKYNFPIKSSWKEQLHYLKYEKVGKYKNHYMLIHKKDGSIAECWLLTSKQILNILMPTIKSQFKSAKKTQSKRIDVAIQPNAARKHGKRIV